MPKDVILTQEGLATLKAELDHLSTTRRREVAARIKEAREFGDISENAEYDDAKNEQAMLEARIAALEDKLRSATVVDASDLGTDVVRVGLGRPRQGRRRQVEQVHDRRLGRGQPGGDEALQRVAGGQGPARPQAGRGGQGLHAARRAQAQDHQDRRRRPSSGRPRRPMDPPASRAAGHPPGASSSAARGAGSSRSRTQFAGVEPIAAVRAAHAGLEAGEETEARHRVAGRLAARRGQGKMAFLDLVDRSGRIQLQARVDVLGAEERWSACCRSTWAT